MAKTRGAPGGKAFIFGSFSRLRGPAAPPPERSLLDHVWYLPPEGVIDLSDRSNRQPLPSEYLPFIAPLSALKPRTINRPRLSAER